MAAAGADLRYPLTELAVMGVRRVLRHLPTFFRLADDAERCFRDQQPDAVILIDYPGFNFHAGQASARPGHPGLLLRAAATVGVAAWPGAAGPQVVRRRAHGAAVRGRLVSFPRGQHTLRRPPVLRRTGPAATRSGFPGIARRGRADGSWRCCQARGIRKWLRTSQMMLAAATRIRRRLPRCPVPRRRVQRSPCRDDPPRQSLPSGLPVEVHVGRTPEIIELADACIAVSGSVSLELMYRAKPTVIVYRMSPVSLWLARRLVKLPYFTLVNLLAGAELFPEIATSRDESERIVGHILGWLNNPLRHAEVVGRIAALRDRVAVPGACDRAAEFLLHGLDSAARHAA